jgi:fumarate reductase flavoprotein subunit
MVAIKLSESAGSGTKQTDAIVMGCGFAGLVAANRLGELGRVAVVLEKGEDQSYLCNSRFTGGVIHVCYKDPMSSSEVLRAAIEAATAGTAYGPLADAMAQNAGRLITWLREHGANFARGGAEEYKRWVLTPIRPQRRGNYWKGYGGDVLMRALEQNLVRHGGRVVRGARVIEASQGPDGRWTVRTENGQTHTAGALVIADGGFQGDHVLVGRHLSPRPERLLQRGAATGCGDGVRIATALGAGTRGLDRFYGHVMTAQAIERSDLWPYPWMDPIAAAGIVVDATGQRFVNESEGGIFIANAIARLDDPLSTWAVFDETIWSGPGARGVIPPNPNLAMAGCDIRQAPTIQALAEAIGVPPANLAHTVSAYNEALASRTGANLRPPRGEGPNQATPIASPPFLAVRLCAGITYTMGGIAIDGHARVLDQAGEIMPGLYAAGSATGGLEGGPHGGYVGGLAKSGVTALQAAEHIAGLST